MFKIELKKAICNNFFYCSMGIAIFIAVGGAVTSILSHIQQMSFLELYETNVYTYRGASLFNNWLGASGDFFTHLFYFLIFLLCTLPYSWSLANEMKSGYINQILIRTSRNQYYLFKYLVTFLSGGLVSVVPMIMNLIICALFIPIYPMDQLSDLYIGVPQRFFGSFILYDTPFLYVALYILLSFIFCGLWATVGVSLSFFSRNRITIIIAPFLFLIFIQVLSNYVSWSNGRTIILSYLIAPRIYGYGNTTTIVILSWIVVILFFDITAYLIKGRGKDAI